MTNGEKVRFGFRSKTQLYFFMVWKEYWHNGEVVFAKILFAFGLPKKYR